MRYGLFLVFLFCSGLSHADVFTCRTPAGEVVYSDLPCLKGETIDKITPSESASDPEAAQRELERQKAYAKMLAAENAKAKKLAPGPALLPDRSSPPPTWPGPTPVSPSSSGTGSGTPSSSR